MKKLLSILAAVGLTATASTSVVACSSVSKKDGQIKMTVKNTKDLTWGEDGAIKGSKTVSTITNLFKQSSDKKIKNIAKHVKKELGLDDWFDKDGNSTMITTYYGTTKPSFKDGKKYDDAEVNKGNDNDKNKNDFATDAAKGKTLYILLRKAEPKATDKVKVAVLVLSFSDVSK